MDKKNVILGTAGHIDHGKSSLVKALTGTDPDRLKEEKERGITIDLGFANLSYPDGVIVGIVDVPGHEKLIKNMLAGAGGIDILMLVIAADEGVMPQTREHLAICNMLKIKTGIIAITKIDTVDKDWLELIISDVRDFVKGTLLENSDIIPVSSKTGENLETLKKAIHNAAKGVCSKLINSIFRMPIDRVFTLKGFGTVVTGTAISGKVTLDMPVEILPAGITTKVRGLQSHGKPADTAYAGQRIGINLQGVNKEDIKRGDTVLTSGVCKVTNTIDVVLEMLDTAPLLKDKSLVHLYLGTSETVARVIIYDKNELKPNQRGYCQFRLEDGIVAMSGDRYIIRRFSPLETIGGGTVLDPLPEKRRKKEGIPDLEILENGSLPDKIECKIKKSALNGVDTGYLEGWIYADRDDIKSALNTLLKQSKIFKSQEIYFHSDVILPIIERLKGVLKDFHKENPLKEGMTKEDVKACLFSGKNVNERIFNILFEAEGVTVKKDIVRLSTFSTGISTIKSDIQNKIINILEKSGYQPPTKTELQTQLNLSEKETNDILNLMSKEGVIVRINDAFYITKSRYDRIIEMLKEYFKNKQTITVSEFRELLNTSRKYAMPIIEFLDTKKVTIRIGDVRKLMIKANS